MSSSISEMLATMLEESRQAAAEAQAAHSQAVAKAQALAARIAEAREKQAAITSRRLAGTASPDEAAEHHALQGDIEELGRLHAHAEREAQFAAPDEALARLARAENDWKAHQERAVIEALHDRAVSLERSFTACLAELAGLIVAAGGQNLREYWQPSPDLEAIMLHSRPATIAGLRRAA